MDFTPILKALTSLFEPAHLIPKTIIPCTVMILAPHPDDESIIGSLPLRLAHENGAHIINVAVTLGSKKERQTERLQEVTEACELLQMELVVLNENWKHKEKELTILIKKYQPCLILAPHSKDHHPVHIKTGELLKKALLRLDGPPVLVAWTEFWGHMTNPNIMVEVPLKILELQMQALEKHQGEVARNPYHLRLPAWMMDNVRRGSELIVGNSTRTPQFAFAVLYRLQLFKNGRFVTPKIDSTIGIETNIGQIFKLILEAASGSRTKVK